MTTHVGVRPLAQAVSSLLARPEFSAREPTRAGLAFRERPWPRGVAPRVDVYLPERRGPHPSVLLVHGGAFTIGSRRMKPVRFLATRLVEAGYAVAACDYRRLLRGGTLERGVDDVSCALDWWRAQAEGFDLDLNRLSLVGLSAGATLALLASARTSSPLAHVVSAFALYDLAALSGRLPRLLGRLLVGGPSTAWRAASPAAMPLCSAPLTILHGDADALTPVAGAADYAARREVEGLSTRLVVYPHAPHGFFNHARSPLAQTALRDLLAALP
jgi:acetyl esterase/lipase